MPRRGISPPPLSAMKKNTGLLMLLAILAGGGLFLLFPGRDAGTESLAPKALSEVQPGPRAAAPAASPEEPPTEPGLAGEALYDRFDHVPVQEDMLADEVSIEIPVSEEGFDAMPELSPSAQLSRTIAQLQSDTLIALDEYGRTMLSSTSATLRAMGGILMFKAGAMDEAVLKQLAADADESVPFLVLEWIRDYGTPELSGQLLNLLAARNLDPDRLADDILSGRFSVGGGRVAIDFLADQLSEGERWEVLEEIAGNPEAEYDLRMRAILRLGAEPDSRRYREELAKLRTAAAEEGEDWDESLQRLAERLMDDEESALAPRDQVTTRDLNLILGNDYVFMARDLALYLEDRLLTPGVAVEPGCADMVAAFLKDYPEQDRDWNVEDEEVLDRLAALKERMDALEAGENPEAKAD